MPALTDLLRVLSVDHAIPVFALSFPFENGFYFTSTVAGDTLQDVMMAQYAGASAGAGALVRCVGPQWEALELHSRGVYLCPAYAYLPALTNLQASMILTLQTHRTEGRDRAGMEKERERTGKISKGEKGRKEERKRTDLTACCDLSPLFASHKMQV